jgi:hypothetical protein
LLITVASASGAAYRVEIRHLILLGHRCFEPKAVRKISSSELTASNLTLRSFIRLAPPFVSITRASVKVMKTPLNCS